MPAHPPAVAANAMVATSHPLATRAGLRMLERGGNAADAMLAAAAVLCVGEPLATGVGGDMFALVWRDGELRGLDAAGPAPRSAAPLTPVDLDGPRSVTAPGAVAGWDELARTHARFGLDVHLADAIDAAENGVAVTPHVARSIGRRVGERYTAPELARTLRTIAEHGPDGFYRGPIADAIVAASWLEQEDLDAVETRWVEPLHIDYRGVTVVELPPPTQGIAALEALALLALGEPTLEAQVDCVRLALADAFANVRDGADVTHLLQPSYLEQRRRETALAAEPPAGTVYLCAVDADGMAVSFIQSLYEGRGPLAGNTGIQLQNRGAGFAVIGASKAALTISSPIRIRSRRNARSWMVRP